MTCLGISDFSLLNEQENKEKKLAYKRQTLPSWGTSGTFYIYFLKNYLSITDGWTSVASWDEQTVFNLLNWLFNLICWGGNVLILKCLHINS